MAPSGYVKRGHKKCRMAASPVRPAKICESTGRPDKRSAIRLGNIKAIYSLSVGLRVTEEIVEQRDISFSTPSFIIADFFWLLMVLMLRLSFLAISTDPGKPPRRTGVILRSLLATSACRRNRLRADFLQQTKTLSGVNFCLLQRGQHTRADRLAHPAW